MIPDTAYTTPTPTESTEEELNAAAAATAARLISQGYVANLNDAVGTTPVRSKAAMFADGLDRSRKAGESLPDLTNHEKLRAIIALCEETSKYTTDPIAIAAAASTISGIRLAMETCKRSWLCEGTGEAVDLYRKAHSAATTYLMFTLNHWKALV